MNLKGRVGRLEAVAAPVEPPTIILVFVSPSDAARVANGIQCIHYGEQNWLREPGETEDAFRARVLAELPPVDVDSTLTGLAAAYATSRLTADYGEHNR